MPCAGAGHSAGEGVAEYVTVSMKRFTKENP
jgi:hypothetical protein